MSSKKKEINIWSAQQPQMKEKTMTEGKCILGLSLVREPCLPALSEAVVRAAI
jgi:hypothetical protein